MKTLGKLMESGTQFNSDQALLSGEVPSVELHYLGGSINMEAFRIYLSGVEVGQARFFSNARKTLLIRFDLPESFSECDDWFRGELEDDGTPFSCPAWNLYAAFLESFKTHPFNP